MKGDFSRLTFSPEKHYGRVLLQQGRMMLDADWNEQVAILSDRLQTLAADVTSNPPINAGAPAAAPGFAISAMKVAGDDFAIGAGRYYVDGICCVCETATSYLGQPLPAGIRIDPNSLVLVFLDVWEALVSPVDDPDLLEPALAGQDTALRSRIAWQVRTQRLPPEAGKPIPDFAAIQKDWPNFLAGWQPANRGVLRARLAGPPTDTGRRASPIGAAAKFRGPENQLYRVEVHAGGAAGVATFKWSRDNGQFLLPLDSLQGTVATVSPNVAERAALLIPGTWVEVSDMAARAAGSIDALVQIKSVDAQLGRIEFTAAPKAAFDVDTGVALRRWDQLQGPANQGGGTVTANGQAIVEGTAQANWLALEDGLEIQFAPAATAPAHIYAPGTYWLIPARASESVLLWPATGVQPEGKPPDGIGHHFAPLALFNSGTSAVTDLRTVFGALSAPGALSDLSDQLDALGEQLSEVRARLDKLEKK